MKKVLLFCFFSWGLALAEDYNPEINHLRDQKREYIDLSSKKFSALQEYNHFLERMVRQVSALDLVVKGADSAEAQITRENVFSFLPFLISRAGAGIHQVELLQVTLPFEWKKAAEALEDFPELRKEVGEKGDLERFLAELADLKVDLEKRREEWEKILGAYGKEYAGEVEERQANDLAVINEERSFGVATRNLRLAVDQIKKGFYSSLWQKDFSKAMDFLTAMEWGSEYLPLFYLGKTEGTAKSQDYQSLMEMIRETRQEMMGDFKVAVEMRYAPGGAGAEKGAFQDWWEDLFSGSSSTRKEAKKRTDAALKVVLENLPLGERREGTLQQVFERVEGNERRRWEVTATGESVRIKEFLVIERKGGLQVIPGTGNGAREKLLLRNPYRKNRGQGTVLNLTREYFHEFPKREAIQEDHKRIVTHIFKNPTARSGALSRETATATGDYLAKLKREIHQARQELPPQAPNLLPFENEVQAFDDLRKKYENLLVEEALDSARLHEQLASIRHQLSRDRGNIPANLWPPDLRGDESREGKDKLKNELLRASDIGLGLMMGTPYDFMEFFWSVSFDQSLLEGAPVDNSGKMIRAAAVFVPFVSAGMIMKGGKAIGVLANWIKSGQWTEDVAIGASTCYHFFPSFFKKILDNESGNLIPETFVGIKKLKDEAPELLQNWRKTYHLEKVLEADVVNEQFLRIGHEAAYQKGTKIFEFFTTRPEVWVRVHEADRVAGRWMMRKEAIKGLTPEGLRAKYALPSTPTHFSEVHIPPQTLLRKGKIGRNGFGGDSEGAVQYEIIGQFGRDWFKNTKLIEGVLQ